MTDASGDRTTTWMPLLQRLTSATDTWLVYKNIDSALTGTGDVDSTASPAEWDSITSHFFDWASPIGPGVVCPHIPGGINLVAVPPGDLLLEVGVKEVKTYRGAVLFDWEQLVGVAVDDARGFRVVRRGTEGVLKLVLNGIEARGRENVAGIEGKGVRDALLEDPAGAAIGAELILGGLVTASVNRLVTAVVDGGWDRPAASAIRRGAYLMALRTPSQAATRMRFQLAGREPCPVTEALLGNGRRIPGDRIAWWTRVVASHDRVG